MIGDFFYDGGGNLVTAIFGRRLFGRQLFGCWRQFLGGNYLVAILVATSIWWQILLSGGYIWAATSWWLQGICLFGSDEFLIGSN